MKQLETSYGAFLFQAEIPDNLPADVLSHPRSAVSTLTLSEQATKHRVAHLSGAIVLRMLWLLRQYQEGGIQAHRFNCYSAAKFLLGSTGALRWEDSMEEQGEQQYVHDAVRHMTSPFLFQICGKYFPTKHVSQHGVLHAGLVLGANSAGEPIVLDKDCHRALRLGPWSNVWPTYFKYRRDPDIFAEYVTCSEQRR